MELNVFTRFHNKALTKIIKQSYSIALLSSRTLITNSIHTPESFLKFPRSLVSDFDISVAMAECLTRFKPPQGVWVMQQVKHIPVQSGLKQDFMQSVKQGPPCAETINVITKTIINNIPVLCLFFCHCDEQCFFSYSLLCLSIYSSIQLSVCL